MIKKDTSAILLNWQRSNNLDPIIRQLYATGIISEVIVWNNNPELKLAGKNCTVINSSFNYKAYARYGVAMLAKEKNIIFQDDDLLFRPEDIVALHQEFLENPARIYGFKGRNLEQGSYTQTDAFGEVDIVLGQFMLFSKDLLASVYGDILNLTPFERGDDIAFSLLANTRHICRDVPRQDLGGHEHALWRDPEHFKMRQGMVDRILERNKDNQLAS